MGPSRIYKNFFAQLVLFACLLFPGVSISGVATEIVVNKSVLLNLQRPLERVAIATPAIAELIVISPTQLQINGSRIGTTSLIVWEKGGKSSFFDIRVKGDTGLLESQIREVAPNDSITVDYANETIVLAGKASNDETIAKAVQIARAYAAKEENGADPLLPAAKSNDSGEIYGHSRDTDPFNSRTDEAANQNPDNDSKVKVLNHIVVDNPQQVLLEVKVAQVDKNALKSLGISVLVQGAGGEGFSNQVGAPDSGPTLVNNEGIQNRTPGIAGAFPWLGAIGPLAPYQLGGALFKSGLGGVLRALATKNLAKMLAEPNLLVRSGQVGRFLAGSKIPISVVSGVGAISGTTIEYIDVGVKLKFRPSVLENGLISLKIDPAEVSSISGTLAVNGYPIIDTREIRTEVRLRDGESLVLAGLLSEEAVKTMSKIPILGDIPILGALFRSTQDDMKQKELVFFISPKIVAANAPGSKVELPTDKQLTPEQEKEFQWIPSN
jgi:pilus assembly protein CpaC